VDYERLRGRRSKGLVSAGTREKEEQGRELRDE